ncbi:hypothetical protein [Sphingomonas turrisvirgatae]|uniref:Uncharacterized protein n=1 Tax=Sphingomonas turrisvirgatae TaxID=1888892 RepID=A0A1E3LXQ2_9SPHN|nr:hypothetical protein [Sphingomonas turrisvirgatae]ODP38577.1 hypothetical protein BFL28_00585 [Sphingomonas turrisvirgatae]
MRAIINGFAAAVVLIATPAFAETKPGTPAPAAAPSQDEGVVKDKRYCLKFDVTGSRLSKTACKTRSEWINDQGFDPLAPQK